MAKRRKELNSSKQGLFQYPVTRFNARCHEVVKPFD